LDYSTAVFVAEVVVITLVEHPQPIGVRYEKDIKLRVWESWKGVADPFIILRTGKGGGDCGCSFEVGHRYIIFARQSDEGHLRTSICSRTVPWVGQADLLSALGPPRMEFQHQPGFEDF
jgi:hypothetical protein